MRSVGMRCAVSLALAFLGGLSGSANAQTAGTGAVTVRSEDAQFIPIDPSQPDLAQIAVLRGDPNTGPSSMLMRMRKMSGVLHYHTADYELVLIQGRMKHTLEGQAEQAAPELGPGSYWHQPKMQPHADTCLSEVCLMFITWSGKRDAIRATGK
jgi:hypothetical protein